MNTLSRPQGSITHQVLSWNPQGKRGIGSPNNTWRRELETDSKITGMSWKDLEKMTLDKKAWRDMIVDPCLHGDREEEGAMNSDKVS
jgi:hypothetical protein